MTMNTEERVLKFITHGRRDVFLRSDFSRLGTYGQIGRALRRLVGKGKLIKIGHGLYGRARISSITGKPIAVKDPCVLARAALARLGIKTVPTWHEWAYNVGISTQVPTGRVIGVLSRVRRKIRYSNVSFEFQKVILSGEGRPEPPGGRELRHL
jgi:hypothetical protein